MMGAAAVYTPETGSPEMSILGGAGFIATSVVLPVMGESIQTAGPQITLRNMAVLPAILFFAFIFLSFWVKSKKAES